QRPHASGLDAQHPAHRRRSHRRGISGQGRHPCRERARGYPRSDRQTPVCGIESDRDAPALNVRPTARVESRTLDGRTVLRGALLSSVVAILFTSFLGAGAQPPESQPPGGGRGRGPSGPPQPTPRLADGTPNLGRVADERGVWQVPYITNMGERIIEEDGKTH